MKQISILQLKKFFKKDCQLYAVHVLDIIENKVPWFEEYRVLQKFKDVFFDEVTRLAPKRNIDFKIDLVLKSTSTSKTIL